MLCPKCDASRFPVASVQNNNTNTKKMSPSAKAKTASKSKQLNSVDSKSDVTDANTVATNTTPDDQISSLRAEIQCQRELIAQLQQQLRSVLSILGIAEQDI
jgi:hypothetical protein